MTEPKMDKDLVMFKRRQAFIEGRTKAYKKIIKEFPEGLTKDNLEQFKKRMKEVRDAKNNSS